jgi:GNAT superfamily N-acetyltransferase
MTFQLRRMELGDIEAGLRLCRAAGWNQLESDWRCFLDWNPEGCRVAVSGGAVAGTVGALRYQERFAWISMLLVDPAVRGQGIGSALLREALRILEGVATVRLDATPAGQAVYERYGFRSEYPLARVRAVAPGPSPAGFLSRARTMMPADLPRVLEMDRDVFGADRSALLNYLYASAPAYAFVAESEARITGYSFGRRGYRANHLGPIVSQDESVARSLLSICMERNPGGGFSLDAPRRNGAWLQWMASLGLAEERPFLRMFRGSNAWPGEPERVFAIAGPEFG